MKKTLRYVLLFAALFFSDIPGLIVTFIACAILSESTERKLRAQAIVNVALIFLTDLAFRHRMLQQDMLYMAEPESVGQLPRFVLPIVRIVAVASLFAIFWCGHRLYHRLGRRYIVLVNCAFMTALAVAYNLSVSQLYLKIYFTAVVVLYAKYFWSLLYTQAVLPENDGWNPIAFASSLPFWSFFSSNHINAMPRGYGELVKTQRSDVAAAQVAGLRLIYFGAAFKFVRDYYPLIVSYLPGAPIRFYSSIGLKAFNLLNLPFYQYWLNDFANGAYFILWNVWAVSTIVGLVRFCGFQIPTAMSWPQYSRNFNDFLKRIYFYYSETIIYFFYFPFEKVLTRKLRGRTRAAVTTFVSLLCGGFFAHLLLELQYDLRNPPSYYLQLVLRFMPYIFSLATLGALSAATHHYKKGKDARWIPALGYFLLYFCCLATHTWYVDRKYLIEDSSVFADYALFICRHFGL